MVDREWSLDTWVAYLYHHTAAAIRDHSVVYAASVHTALGYRYGLVPLVW